MRLYNIAGSRIVFLKGLWPSTCVPVVVGQVRRVKLKPPSVETDAPEMLIGLAKTPRESLKATTTWSVLSGFAAANVSDCVTWVPVSGLGLLIRSTSAPSGADIASMILPADRSEEHTS